MVDVRKKSMTQEEINRVVVGDIKNITAAINQHTELLKDVMKEVTNAKTEVEIAKKELKDIQTRIEEAKKQVPPTPAPTPAPAPASPPVQQPTSPPA